MTKIDIISGFLGAGKTTLIKELLEDALKEEQVVLIENEFGEIGIDGGFLKEAGIQIREMNSGCICCSLVGDFGASLKEVIKTYHPDRILIEPSGVGKLSDVIKAVQDVQEETGLVLNSYTTVVDAKKCKMYMRNFGEFFNNQVEYAGAIILSRTDIVDEAKAVQAMELLREINPRAAIITTPIKVLGGKKLLEVMEHPVSLEEELLKEEVCPECGHIHEHHHEHHHEHEEECHEHHHEHEEEAMNTITAMRKNATSTITAMTGNAMSIITAMTGNAMNITMTTGTPADADTIMNMAIIMRTKCLPVGEERR